MLWVTKKNRKSVINQVIANTWWCLVIMITLISCASTHELDQQKPLVIRKQGSFAVGGKVMTNPGTIALSQHS
jgi:hypothetical protein